MNSPIETEKKEVLSTLNPSDCSAWIETKKDEMTGESSTGAKTNIIISQDGGTKGLGILLYQSSLDDKMPIMNIMAAGAGSCIDKGNKINVLFTDGSRTVLRGNSDFNCKSNTYIYFVGVFGKTTELRELKTK